MRKRTKRMTLLKLPPKGLRAKMPQAHKDNINLMVLDFVDQVSRGEAGDQTLFDYIRSIFTVSVMADLMGLGPPEMAEQVQLCTRLVERWQKTGRVLFSGPDLQLARDGTEVVRQIVEEVDQPTAFAAVRQSAVLLRATGWEMPKESA